MNTKRRGSTALAAVEPGCQTTENASVAGRSDTTKEVPLAELIRIYTVPTVAQNPRMLYRIAQLVGGFTVQQTQGGWVNPDGEVEIELSAVIELLHNDTEVIQKALHIVEQYAWLSGEDAVISIATSVDMVTRYREGDATYE